MDHIEVRQGVITAMRRLGKTHPTSTRQNKRYAENPQYREKINRTAREWNANNPDRRRIINHKYSKQNGAAASKRYRERQKERSAA